MPISGFMMTSNIVGIALVLPSIMLSWFVKKDRYTQAYEVYLRLCGQRKANLACLRENIPTALQELQLEGKDKQRFNILSIGAGDGFVDHEIFKIVEDGYLNAENQMEDTEILNTAVEPHPNQVAEYRKLIESRCNQFKRPVEFDLKPMKYEEYVDSKHDKNQYDLIHAIHSLYFVDDLESTLKRFYYDELGDKGLISILVADHDHITRQLAAVVHKNQEDKKQLSWIFDDATAIVKKEMWKFERIACSFSIDVTGILRENSEEGRLLLDFLTCHLYFDQTADKETIDDVHEILKNMASENDQGGLEINASNDLILIYKS